MDSSLPIAQKNALTSYGLTLVAGFPLSAGVLNQLEDLRHHVEGRWPGAVTWYRPEQLHITLAAPLRGRYRDAPPLQRHELPADLPGFLQALAALLDEALPFTLSLRGLYRVGEGILIAGASSPLPIRQRLAGLFRGYPGLDRPHTTQPLHLTLGHLAPGRPPCILKSDLEPFTNQALGDEVVQRAWLVHYANRTLNQVVGKVSFPTRQPVEVEQVLGDLKIAQRSPQEAPAGAS